MSTDYRLTRTILMNDLFDGCLGDYGINEHVVEGTTWSRGRCLTDGRNAIWVYGDEVVTCITRYGGNDSTKILQAIAEVFDTDIFSEHEPQYWGFDTEEEWHLHEERLAQEAETKFHADILKYVRGEPNDLCMEEANIVKRLVADDPGLVAPGRKKELMEAIKAINKIHWAELPATVPF